LITCVAFSDEQKAEIFERYLKSGSGHAFANKRLWQVWNSVRTKLGTHVAGRMIASRHPALRLLV
jgi:hypothetical protein